MNPLEEDEEAWPDEPDEFDPDSLGPDPPDASSNVDSRVKESLGATADIDDKVFKAFWGSVVFLNVALAALSVGAMLVYFRGDWSMGGPALLIGTITALFTARYYLRGKRHLREKDDQSESGTGEGDEELSPPDGATDESTVENEPTEESPEPNHGDEPTPEHDEGNR